jgi:hypothetical protein
MAAANGDLGAAVERLGELEERSRSGAGLYRPLQLPRIVSIALDAGKRELANTFLETPYPPAARVVNSVLAARAVAAEHDGAFADALASHEHAATGWAEYGFVLGRAEALHGVGRCFVALGQPGRATAPFDEAQSLFGQLGALVPQAAADEPRAADRAT